MAKNSISLAFPNWRMKFLYVYQFDLHGQLMTEVPRFCPSLLTGPSEQGEERLALCLDSDLNNDSLLFFFPLGIFS